MDEADLIGDPTPMENQKAMAAALRRQQQLGMLGQLTGDSVLSHTGQSMVQNAQHQQQLLSQSNEKSLMRALAQQKEKALEQYRDARLAGGASLDPASVVHLRPDFAEALGGEDAVMGMDPRQIAAALKTFDSKKGMDYKNDALRSKVGAQNDRTATMQALLGIRQKKLSMDVQGRAVPGMEMEDGFTMQPKEAAEAKTLRGNVQRSLQALNALRDDFNQFGPQRLASLGGILPTEALTRMEGNRARLLEAAMKLQGMNPTIGHQELLQHQIREPGDFRNMNHAAYLAQLNELEKSIKEAESAFASGHGVKRLAPAPRAVEGEVGTATAHPQANAALEWAKANPADPRAAKIMQALGAK